MTQASQQNLPSTSAHTSRYARNGWKYDHRITAMMVDDMRFNPTLAAKVLLGIRVPPHQELRFWLMWFTFYTCDDSGFSTGKTFTNAVISALRSMLFPPRVSGILSKTFAQGKLTFNYYDRWYETSKIFRSSIRHRYGKPRLVHGNDVWQAEFRGGSEIRILPPNFLQDAERIKSERWNDGYFDEWRSFGNFRAFNSTIIGRVTRNNSHPNCPARQNHIHLSSTPGFTHEPSYELIKRLNKNLRAGNKDYARFTCNYRHIPRKTEWEDIVNRKVIFTMQTTNPPGIVKSEVDGLWQKDSLSYYSSRIIYDAQSIPRPLLKREHDLDVYIGGFDTARGGGQRSQLMQRGDDFSFTVLRLRPNNLSVPQHVLTVRINDAKSVHMSALIHELHRDFHFSLIVYDPGGGGLFVADELQKPMQFIRDIETVCTPILNIGDTSGAVGHEILVPFMRGNYWIKMAYGTMMSDSVLVNRMHGDMVSALTAGTIELMQPWDGWTEIESFWDVDGLRKFLNETSGLSEAQRAHAESDLAVRQLVQVDVARKEDGAPRLDRWNMYKFRSDHKKDSAYSLCYAHFGVPVYSYMQDIMGDSDAGEYSIISENI